MEALFKYLSKDFIRGLGIGFLISALLILTFPDEKAQINPLTDDEIKSKAKELGMVDKKDLSSEINKDTINKNTNEKNNPNTINQGNNGNTGITKPKITAPAQKKPIKVVIPEGSNLSDIADILYKKGAIKDKKKFISLVDKFKLATKFHTGKYTIPANAETLDIITKMTK